MQRVFNNVKYSRDKVWVSEYILYLREEARILPYTKSIATTGRMWDFIKAQKMLQVLQWEKINLNFTNLT